MTIYIQHFKQRLMLRDTDNGTFGVCSQHIQKNYPKLYENNQAGAAWKIFLDELMYKKKNHSL